MENLHGISVAVVYAAEADYKTGLRSGSLGTMPPHTVKVSSEHLRTPMLQLTFLAITYLVSPT